MDRTLKSKLQLIIKDKDRPPIIAGKAEDFEQIFFVMIQNAIQATDGKEWRHLVIDASITDHAINLEFSDNCSGIATENLDKILKPFFTTKKMGDGTGLGLSIVQRILAEYSGTIRVESELNKGTTFYLSIPLDHKVSSKN